MNIETESKLDRIQNDLSYLEKKLSLLEEDLTNIRDCVYRIELNQVDKGTKDSVIIQGILYIVCMILFLELIRILF